MILHQLIDYEILRIIWWLLLGVVLIGFAVTGGFDLGTGALLPFVAKTDVERRVVINSIGPVWEGDGHCGRPAKGEFHLVVFAFEDAEFA